MTQTNPVGRAVSYVLGPPARWVGRRIERRVQWVGRRIERRVRRAMPEPPVWFVPVVIAISFVSAVAVQLVEERRSARERATAEPQATAERGTTTECDESGQSDAEEIVEALETLGVDFPPAPPQEAVRAAYREQALETHPDQGGDAEQFKEVRAAWERIPERQELSGDGDDRRSN